MAETLRPETTAQILDAVKWAMAEETPLEVVGGASKRGYGRPVEAAHTLDLSACAGITSYEPSELYLSCRAGTTMAEIATAIADADQMLAFEPPDLGPLFGGVAGSGTLAGAVACNLSGPRRVMAGAARDHVLGFNAVSGRGEEFKSGGTVVKNVTGFDLSKLMAGSFGTLAVMTDITVKTLPRPEKVRTVLARWPADGVYDPAAMKAMAAALGSAHEVTAAAYLPANVASHSAVDYIRASGGAVTAIRVDGPGPSAEHRASELTTLMARFCHETEVLHSQNSQTFWREVGDVQYFASEQERPIWCLSVAPSDGAAVALDIHESIYGEIFYDWGGGLVWLALPPSDDAGAEIVRAVVDRFGGHATLVRAAADIRARVPVFHPQPAALADVTRRVKEGFDPHAILNPGRMLPAI